MTHLIFNPEKPSPKNQLESFAKLYIVEHQNGKCQLTKFSMSGSNIFVETKDSGRWSYYRGFDERSDGTLHFFQYGVSNDAIAIVVQPDGKRFALTDSPAKHLLITKQEAERQCK